MFWWRGTAHRWDELEGRHRVPLKQVVVTNDCHYHITAVLVGPSLSSLEATSAVTRTQPCGNSSLPGH